MKSKRKVAVAVVAVGALIAATGGWMYVSEAQTPASVPTQQDARNAAAVISAFIEAHPDATTTTTVPATTTTAAPAPTTTTAPATTTTARAPATTTTQAPTTTTAAPQGLVALHPGTSWDWQIGASAPDPSTLANATGAQKMLDVDMENTTSAQIAAIKAKGIVPIAYLETGSWESYRSDASQFPTAALGSNMSGYPDERYLNINYKDASGVPVVENLIKARIKRAADKGFMGIEPDLDDTWQNSTGFPITYSINLAYNHRLADYAHSLGLTFGLKNAAGTQQVADSVSFTDWVLNEQCNQYSECGAYSAYIKAGKAVFQVEYKVAAGTFCPLDNSKNYDGLKLIEDKQNGTNRIPCRNG